MKVHICSENDMPMYWVPIVILYLVLILGAWWLLRRNRLDHEAEVQMLRQEIARLREKIVLMTPAKPEPIPSLSPADLFLVAVQNKVTEEMASGSVSVEAVSAEMNMSTQTFRRRLQSAAGITPKDFILSIQMKKAGTLLLQEKELPIQEVGRQCGFDDASSFAHAFSRYFGCPPTDYRENGQF